MASSVRKGGAVQRAKSTGCVGQLSNSGRGAVGVPVSLRPEEKETNENKVEAPAAASNARRKKGGRRRRKNEGKEFKLAVKDKGLRARLSAMGKLFC